VRPPQRARSQPIDQTASAVASSARNSQPSTGRKSPGSASAARPKRQPAPPATPASSRTVSPFRKQLAASSQ